MRIPGKKEFRLVRMDGEDPVFAWVRTADDSVSDALRVPRKLMAEIEATPEKWEALRNSVADGMVVDLQRELLAD
jgi:hypothetical protein